MTHMDSLYADVFHNKYISNKIYQCIYQIQRFKNSSRYSDIVDVLWMIEFNHIGLLQEKIKRKENLFFDPEQSRQYLLLARLQDADLIVALYQMYKQQVSLKKLFNHLIFVSHTVAIKKFYDQGLLSSVSGSRKRFIFIDQKWKIDPDLLGYLLDINWFSITADTIKNYRLNFTKETLELVVSKIPQPLEQSVAKALLSRLCQPPHQCLFKLVQHLFQQPGQEFIQEHNIDSLVVTDKDLFIYLFGNTSPEVLSDNFLKGIKADSSPSIEILKHFGAKGAPIVTETNLDSFIQRAIVNHSKDLVNYLLDQFPNYQLDKVTLTPSLVPVHFTKKNSLDNTEFYQDLDFVCKLLDRGLDSLFWFFANACLEQSLNHIFHYLWKRFSNRIRITQETVAYQVNTTGQEEHLEDLGMAIMKRCCFDFNIEIIKFLISQGWSNFDENQSMAAWEHIYRNNVFSVEFMKYLVTFIPASKDSIIRLINCLVGQYKNRGDYILSILNATLLLFKDQLKDDDFKLVHRDCLKNYLNLKVIFTLDSFSFKCDYRQLARIEEEQNYVGRLPAFLANGSLEMIKYLENNEYLASLMGKDESILRLIHVTNYPVLKYLLSKYYKGKTLDQFYSSLGKSRCIPIVDLFITDYSLDKHLLIQESKQSNNTMLLEYLQ
ncbi:hypothetical protein CYY_008787 [Polysphondylium violaceum]|uniref:Uncharacterized protein n=1 Tax=Polysphondylium violaceum TaxID=133409 RepID=A0A8J4UPY4_9MYCE|nr:hypothetical protein CYY_008787 [Polysphondylium violaceum]